MFKTSLPKSIPNNVALVTITLLCTLLVLIFHWGNIDSYLSEDTLNRIVDYHAVESAFKRRPLTTWMIQSTSMLLGITPGKSFVLVNFSLLFLSGFVLGKTIMKTSLKRPIVLVGVVYFFVTFSVLFSFFQPIYSYDEPIQYLLLFSALYFNQEKKWWFYLLTFFFAILARETTLLLIISFLLVSNLKLYKSIAMHLAAVILYFVAYYLLIETNSDELIYRLQITSTVQKNLSNAHHGIVAILSVLLLPLTLVLKLWNLLQQEVKPFLKAFLIASGINTVFVYLFANTYETRLFALPLVFFWLCAGQCVVLWFKEFRISKSNLLVALVLSASISLLFYIPYQPAIGTGGAGLFQYYLSLYTCAALLVLLSEKKPNEAYINPI